MAPGQIENNMNMNMNMHMNIELFMREFEDAQYTEEDYRHITDDIYEVLENHYRIISPRDMINQFGVNGSYRQVLREYANVVPLFELEEFGV
jgi:hypothetical protein